ncbi:MAG TPA: ergothioneine biosynthesis protein EgtB [Solirubrobacteraceae bacterium]
MTQLDTNTLELAREQTLGLVAGISEEDLERVHSPLMSPLVWDLGHIAAFEDLWLGHRHGGLELLRPDLMEVYDAFETPRADRGELPYLRRAEAEEFLADVRTRVRGLDLPDGIAHELVERHERQHGETMLQTLNLARIARPGGASEATGPGGLSGLDLVDVPGGEFTVGAGPDGFAYDNERPRHTVGRRAFRIGRVPITNGDWRSFMRDGGYSRREWWTADGWAWREAEGIVRPLNWLTDELEWRLADGATPLDWQRPVVHVSWYEADAFARSRGVRLPNEVEWEMAATWNGTTRTEGTWSGANLVETGVLGTVAVGGLSQDASPCGALGMIGDVWEWTSSDFHGYPGFVAHPYREYSEVFFGPDYKVLRGGSFATSSRVISPSFRNWDHPHRRQIFAGLRVAADA